eukprot:2425181-Amphidinium_carterae.1
MLQHHRSAAATQSLRPRHSSHSVQGCSVHEELIRRQDTPDNLVPKKERKETSRTVNLIHHHRSREHRL